MSARQVRFAGHEITGVAVAICRFPACTHSGVLHRHTNGQLFLLHLGGDCDLTHEVFNGTCNEHACAWVIPDLLPEEVNEVRAVCRAVARTMPTIHYSFRFDPEATLDRATSQVISQHAPYGLTCSTFVMAVFNSATVRLVDLTNWQTRAEDQAWYGRLLRYMARNGVDQTHIARITSDVTCLRVRPEEAAAACLAPRDQLPAGFAHCEPNGREILRLIVATTDTSLNRATQP